VSGSSDVRLGDANEIPRYQRPRKFLVYLDQNFISEMVKPAHDAVRTDFGELYSVLHEGFWNEQLVEDRRAGPAV
jgi:hypothetical protein